MEAFPPELSDPFGFYPLALRPTPATIINNIFPLTPGAASTPAQITQALLVAGSGLSRIDVFPTAAQFETANTVPIVAVPAVPGGVIAPVMWSMSKVVAIGGAGNQGICSLIYQGTGFGSPIGTLNSDSTNVRVGFGMASSASLAVFGANNPTGLALMIKAAANGGGTSNIAIKFSILFYVWFP